MKLKYYLRGLGIGIILTTIILMISFSQRKNEITDEEIIKRAEALGMVMKEESDSLFASKDEEKETELSESKTEAEEDTEKNTEENKEDVIGETEQIEETEELERDSETIEELYCLVIPGGATCKSVCKDLAKAGVVDDAEAFKEYLKSVGFSTSIRAGQFDIPYGLSYEEIYEILKQGPVRR